MKSASEVQWHTTNMEYGKFYSFVTEQVEERRLQRRSEKRSEVLTKDVINCRAQLQVLHLRDPASPPSTEDESEFQEKPSESYLDVHTRETKFQNAEAKDIKGIPQKQYSDRKVSSSIMPVISIQHDSTPEESNRRMDPLDIEEDTKQLEWILHRLSGKLQPLKKGTPPIKMTSGKPEKILKSRYSQKSRPASHSRLLKVDRPKGHFSPHHRCNVYKHYGYSGQGAKTYWGHNMPLGQKPLYGRRIEGLMKY